MYQVIVVGVVYVVSGHKGELLAGLFSRAGLTDFSILSHVIWPVLPARCAATLRTTSMEYVGSEVNVAVVVAVGKRWRNVVRRDNK